MRDSALSTFLAAGTALFVVAAVGCVPESNALLQGPNDPGPPGSSGCPSGNALGNFKPAGNVAAGFSNIGNVTSYWFASLANENPTGGVPGLIRYCVYSYPAARPTAVDVQATGANGAVWTSRTDVGDFSFARPTGNPSNIPLDGNNTTIGTATWDQVPSEQSILLHINDPTLCADLYGGDPSTCFVKPGQAQACILDIGETDVAYNGMPFGAAACATYSLGFEATQTREFGDEVELGGSARKLVSLLVLFSSWACETGHWFDNTCATTPGTTFSHPITATIYSVKDCGGTPCADQVLASVTQSPPVPYRPSADAACTGTDLGEWFNTVAGVCKPQISTVLTFTFPPGTTLPDRVIWSVAFNTTHYGTAPIGQLAACFAASGGCPYDSFNVGAESFPGAPYAGSDVDPDVAWRNGVPEPDWLGFRPVGAIVTSP